MSIYCTVIAFIMLISHVVRTLNHMRCVDFASQVAHQCPCTNYGTIDNLRCVVDFTNQVSHQYPGTLENLCCVVGLASQVAHQCPTHAVS